MVTRSWSGEDMRHLKLVNLAFVSALFLAGCGETPHPSNAYTGPPLSSAALLLLAGQQVSGLGRIDVDGHLLEVPDVALGSDPVLASSVDKVFAVVRDQNVVYEVDPNTLDLQNSFVTYTDAELQTSQMLACQLLVKGFNPQDVAVDSKGRRWVTRFERPTLAIIEPDGSFSGTVDLSGDADADGLPEAAGIHIAGDHAYVAIERLDRCGGWVPTGPGKILEINLATREVTKRIELGGANPFGRLVPVPWDSSGNTVAVALAGRFLSLDEGDAAAIVKLDTGEIMGFGRETDLQGSVTEVVLAAPDEAYAIVSSPKLPENATSVVRINPMTGQVISRLLDSRSSKNPDGGYCHRGLAVLGDQVLVASKDPCEIGVFVLDRQSGEQLGVIHPAKLPPIAIQAAP
jgi:hypothetical protein